MRDFSKDLILASTHWLSVEEAERRLANDINSDFCLFSLNGHPGDGEYFTLGENRLTDYLKPNAHGVYCLQLDLLLPTYDYVSLYESNLLTAFYGFEMTVQNIIREYNRTGGALWHTVSCTTERDSPVSAFRRTTILLQQLSDDTQLENVPGIFSKQTTKALRQYDLIHDAFIAEVRRHD